MYDIKLKFSKLISKSNVVNERRPLKMGHSLLRINRFAVFTKLRRDTYVLALSLDQQCKTYSLWLVNIKCFYVISVIYLF